MQEQHQLKDLGMGWSEEDYYITPNKNRGETSCHKHCANSCHITLTIDLNIREKGEVRRKKTRLPNGIQDVTRIPGMSGGIGDRGKPSNSGGGP